MAVKTLARDGLERSATASIFRALDRSLRTGENAALRESADAIVSSLRAVVAAAIKR